MQITGTVLNALTNEAVVAASVVVLNPDGTPSSIGTVTDADGAYALLTPLLDNPNASLEVSCVGYSTIDINTIGAQGDVFLSPSSSLLGEVVVTFRNAVKKATVGQILLTSAFIVVLLWLTAKFIK
jgi:voltage-gated potassium channel Kch